MRTTDSHSTFTAHYFPHSSSNGIQFSKYLCTSLTYTHILIAHVLVSVSVRGVRGVYDIYRSALTSRLFLYFHFYTGCLLILSVDFFACYIIVDLAKFPRCQVEWCKR